MNKRIAFGVSILFLMVFFFTLSEAYCSPKDVITWKGQLSFPSVSQPYGPFEVGEAGLPTLAFQWSEWVSKATHGRLIIKWAEPGAIFPVLDADRVVGKGTVDIAFSFGSYYRGRVPEGDIETGGIYFWEDEAQAFECLHKYGLFKALQKSYSQRNIYWLPLHSDAPMGIGTRFPAPSPEAIKGKKIRAVGIQGDYIQLLGGSPVSLPFGEIYMGMKLGTIDGWVGSTGNLEDNKLKEVSKGFVFKPRPSNTMCNLIMNMDSYKALPEDVRELIQRDSPYVTYAGSASWRNQGTWSAKHAEQKYGIKIYSWSSEEADRLSRLAAKEVYPKMAAKSPACAELMKIVMKQMRDYGRID